MSNNSFLNDVISSNKAWMSVVSFMFTPKYSAVLFKIYLWDWISPSLGILSNKFSYSWKKSVNVKVVLGGTFDNYCLNLVSTTFSKLFLPKTFLSNDIWVIILLL